MSYRCRWKFIGRNEPTAKPVPDKDMKIFSLLILRPSGRIFDVFLKDSGKKIGRVWMRGTFCHYHCHLKKHLSTAESFYTNDIPKGEPEGLRAAIRLYKEVENDSSDNKK